MTALGLEYIRMFGDYSRAQIRGVRTGKGNLLVAGIGEDLTRQIVVLQHLSVILPFPALAQARIAGLK
jgi:hypothetical protein